jgi:hypothetical protein
MNKFIIKVLLTALLFFFIYNPPLSFFPVNSGIIVGGLFFILYLLQLLVKISLSKTIKFNKHLLMVITIISLLVVYSFLVPLLNGSPDFQKYKSYLSFLLFYLPGAFGIVALFKKYFTATECLKILILITVLQSIIMLLMFVNPDIKNFFFSLLRDAEDRIKQNRVSGGFRFLGLAFGGSWDLSIVQSLGMMAIALLIKTDRSQNNLKNALFFLLLLVSVFLAGRTGVFGILLSFLLLLIPVRITEIPLYKMTKFIVFLCLVTIPMVFIIRNKIPDTVLDIIQKNFLPWAAEMFQNDNGIVLETKSSNELKTMYFIPSGKTILLGDGYYQNPVDKDRYYMDTDAGYMRHLLFYGIFGSLLLLLLYLLIFYQMYKFSSSPAVRLFVIFMGIYFFVAHAKGDLLGGADMPVKTLFFLYAVIISFCSTQKKSQAIVTNHKI